jgi:hypothetical protein
MPQRIDRGFLKTEARGSHDHLFQHRVLKHLIRWKGSWTLWILKDGPAMRIAPVQIGSVRLRMARARVNPRKNSIRFGILALADAHEIAEAGFSGQVQCGSLAQVERSEYP